MRTGILGGTFDPIHLAHLHAAETALAASDLDRVLFIPAGDPWQKSARQIADASDRVAMVRLAIEEAPGFELDRREIDRDGPTYTIDTLNSFSDEEDLFLILGADAAAGVPTWHRADEVVDRASFLILPRPGADAHEAAIRLPRSEVLEMASLDISSTLIRELAGERRPFRYLVPRAVYGYINDNNLYTKAQFRDSLRETTGTESSS